MVNVRRRKKGLRLGAAAAEAAIVMPILILVTFGAIKYGWLFLKAQQVTNAARHGARMVILPDVELDEVRASVINLLAAANITANAGEIAITSFPVPSLPERTAYNVQITIPTERVDILKISWLPTPDNISASVTMAREGT